MVAGNPYDFQPQATDPNGQDLSFSVANKPAWAGFDSKSGRLSGTPSRTHVGTTKGVLISVTDGGATASLSPFDITVADPNRSPVISGAPATAVMVGQAYVFQPTASDPDGQALVFSVANLPAWAAFDTATGRISGTPTAAHIGTFAGIVITASDGTASASLPSFSIIVSGGVNHAPVIGGAPPTAAAAGQVYSFQPNASDPDGQPLTFAISGRPAWAAFDSSTGRLSGTATAGTFSGIVISVSDGSLSAALPAFSIVVQSANRAPVISGSPATSVTAGQGYSFQPTASDPDGQALTFTIANKPTWATFNTSSGRLSGTPTTGNIGTTNGIVISVSDGALSTSLPAFSIAVQSGNRPPVISGTPGSTATVGQAYGFTPTASDPDGQSLSFSIANKPAWAAFNAATGRLSGTPAAADAGSYAGIVITASDGTLSASLASFTITVEAGNGAPVIGGTPGPTVTAGQAYSFVPAASDPDGQTLTFSITSRPAWAIFDPATGRLFGTPAAADIGVYPGIVITVSDGSLTASLPAFAITVQAANRSPVISGTPAASVTVGQTYDFTPTASDPDGQSLTFSIANKPAWAAFNAATGRLSGTPVAADVGSNPGIVITVSDGTLSVSLASFSIVVQAANRAPVIGGAPSTSVTVGQVYDFQPTASDPDGQALTFSIANKPAWAVFNSATGRLSGTPVAADVGTYSGIVITVSDGTLTASRPAFDITVSQVQLGSATVNWTPPTLNADGTQVANVSGYRIYYGVSASNLSQRLDVPSAGATTALVENLSPATWYFAVSVYTTTGNESALTQVMSKVVN